MKVDAFPLQWPAGWPRTPEYRRTRAKFGKGERVYHESGSSWVKKKDLTIADAVERVRAELRRLGARDSETVISTNLELRLDGLPRSNQRQPGDPGVAVYWRVGSNAQAMGVDLYDRVEHNLAAVAATLESLRAIERHGGAQILNRTFQGFKALPSQATTTMDAETAAVVLSNYHPVLAAPDVLASWEHAQSALRAARSREHPDRGGNPERWHNVETAKSALETHHGRGL